MTSLLNVKSSIHDYTVEIVDDLLKHIENELSSGAFLFQTPASSAAYTSFIPFITSARWNS